MASHGTITREKLIELYVNDKYASMQGVADKLGVSRSSVFKAMKRFGLPSKSSGTTPEVEIPQLSDVEWLTAQLEEKTFRQLAKELGTSVGRIADRAYRYGIKGKSTNRSVAVRAAIQKRYPDGRFGEIAGNWQGGRREMRSGYIYIYAPAHPAATQTGYVMEHRLVAEQTIGRFLEADEIVHHIDGNKANNAPENLVVKNNGQHISEHFLASHEVTGLRRENAALKERVQELEAIIKELQRRI